MGNDGSHPVAYGETIDNDIKCTWRKVCSNKFPGREGHCSASVGGSLYIFGGVTLCEQEGIESDQLVGYDSDKGEWSLIESSGDIPGPRSSATMCSVGKNLYMFGGLSRESGWFNDFYKFDTESKVWTKLSVERAGPSPRDKVASAVIGNLIYIFGGFGPQNNSEQIEPIEEIAEDDDDEYEDESEAIQQDGVQFGWFNDLFIFNTETCEWSNPMQMNLGVPSPRAAHAMCSVNKYLLIFGGRDSQARRNDLHIFDTESRKWVTDLEKVVCGRQPEPRSFHTMTAVGDRVVVTGGRGQSNQLFSDFYIFDTKSQQWLEPVVEGDLPTARGLHTVTLVGDRLILYAGSSNFDPETMQCLTYHSDAFYVNSDEVLSGSSKYQDIHTKVDSGKLTESAKGDQSSVGQTATQSTEPSTSCDPDSGDHTLTAQKEDEEECSPVKRQRTMDSHIP